MSSNEDKVKQKLQEERNRQEIEIARQEEERKKNPMPADDKEVSAKEHQDEVPVTFFTPKPSISGSDWKKILEDYKAKYPNTPVKDNLLEFSSKEDAVNFFREQATSNPPRKFLTREIDQNGKLTGYNMLSCGDGKLYQGTLPEIQDQLKAALKENPNDPNVKEGLDAVTRALNPAQSFKESLLQSKEAAAEPKNESSLPGLSF